MSSRRHKYTLGLLLFILVFLPATACALDTEAKNLLERGRFESEQGNFGAALDYLDQALKLAPTDPNLHLVKGQILYKMERYDEAEALFQNMIATGGPGVRSAAWVELAVMNSRQKRYRQAVEYYNQVLELHPERADLLLARGTMYMNLKDYARAEADFQQAARDDPILAAPAEFYLALLCYHQEDYPGTYRKIDAALAKNPEPGLAQQMRSFLDSVRKEEKSLKRFGASASMVLQYDDNVPLEPADGWGNGVTAAYSQKEDWSWGAVVAGTLYGVNTRLLKAGVDYTFRGQFYFDLSDFDNYSHTLGGFVYYNQAPWYFRLRSDLGFYYADSEDKMTLWSISPAVIRLWGSLDRTELQGYYGFKAMEDGTDDINRVAGSLTHFHTFVPPKTADDIGLTARGGLRLEHESPNGDISLEYTLYEMIGGLSFPLPGQLEGDLGFGYAWVDFEQNDFLASLVTRDDRRLTLSAKLGRAISDNFRVDLQWVYTRNDSNLENAAGLDLYEYERNVYSLVLSGRY
jgi:tetratricopeptide (TPR) repeat protein